MSSSASEWEVCVGVDGGGTGTRVQLVDCETGEAVGQIGTGGCSNANSVGVASAELNFTTAFHSALASLAAGRSRITIGRLLLSMSGADRPEDVHRIRQWVLRAIASYNTSHSSCPCQLFADDEERIDVKSDAIAALMSGTPDQELYGAVVISGTGMVVFAFPRDREPSRAGGWGPLLGEPGSGYSIGSAVLKATTRATDGTGPETALSKAVLDHLSLQTTEELIPWMYSDISWSRIASLAPLAFAHYEADAVAKQILETEANLIIDALEAALRRAQLSDDPHSSFPVVCSGGNFTHPNSVYYAVFTRILQQRQLNSEWLRPAQLYLPSISPELAAALHSAKKHRRSSN